MVDLKEVMVANGITILSMIYLLLCRRKNRESVRTEDKIYDAMILLNFFGALVEIISFLVDGSDIPGGRAINYISNSLCFAGTVSIGLLWCMYVKFYVYRNYKRLFHNVRMVMIPWLVELMAILCNLIKPGLLFTVSENNVYSRSSGVVIGYVTLFIYFAYSICLVLHSRKQKIKLHFFPVQYFVIPCIMGVVLHFFFYGITTSYISVAVALMFVQMQDYAEGSYSDELSGLFNRRYLNGILAKKEVTDKGDLYGILMDVNDFKSINDTFGHSVGDRAISCMREILLKSLPSGGTAIRYAGDEFVVLLTDAVKGSVFTVMEEIDNNLAEFNMSGEEPFSLSVSMGHARFEENDDAEAFLSKMDERMYEEKQKYHLKRRAEFPNRDLK